MDGPPSLSAFLGRYADAAAAVLLSDHANPPAWHGGVSLRNGKSAWNDRFLVVAPCDPVMTDNGPFQAVIVYKKQNVCSPAALLAFTLLSPLRRVRS